MINKFQQGGQMGQQQQALAQFIQGIAQVAQVDPQQVMQLAQQEPERLETAVQVFQQTQDILQAAQAFFQKEVQSAKKGAKLNYLKKLTGKCPEGYELRYFKAGGHICSKCMAKKKLQGDVIEEIKCGSKMKKKKKGCGGFKVSKAQLGTIIEKFNNTKVALKQHKHGGSLNGIPFKYQSGGSFKKKSKKSSKFGGNGYNGGHPEYYNATRDDWEDNEGRKHSWLLNIPYGSETGDILRTINGNDTIYTFDGPIGWIYDKYNTQRPDSFSTYNINKNHPRYNEMRARFNYWNTQPNWRKNPWEERGGVR